MPKRVRTVSTLGPCVDLDSGWPHVHPTNSSKPSKWSIRKIIKITSKGQTSAEASMSSSTIANHQSSRVTGQCYHSYTESGSHPSIPIDVNCQAQDENLCHEQGRANYHSTLMPRYSNFPSADLSGQHAPSRTLSHSYRDPMPCSTSTSGCMDDWNEAYAHKQKYSNTLSTPTADSETAQRKLSGFSEGSYSRFPQLFEFEVVDTLGTGTFGRVFLVRDKLQHPENPAGYYALKTLRKAHIVRLKQVAHLNSEKAVLSRVWHPFIVKLHSTYQDSINCYMLMEFVVGGEIFTHLRRAKRFSVDITRFYISSLVLVLAHLHGHQILYRDLKPENILLDQDGYVKVADFGFARHLDVEERAWTLCGTPEYLSPEIIETRGQTFASDYWALGILMYEMLCGFPPFYADTPFATYEKIVQAKLLFPSHVDASSRHLIQSLLTKDFSKRLGNLNGGVQDVMQHPWFSGVDWQALLDRRVTAPIIPNRTSAGDTTNFQKYGAQDTNDMPGIRSRDAFLQDQSRHDIYRHLFPDF